MRYLSLVKYHQFIISQIETNLSDEQVIELDKFLRDNNILSDDLELCTTEDV